MQRIGPKDLSSSCRHPEARRLRPGPFYREYPDLNGSR